VTTGVTGVITGITGITAGVTGITAGVTAFGFGCLACFGGGRDPGTYVEFGDVFTFY